MKQRAPGVVQLIGNTPLVEVTRMDTGPCQLFLKLESQNPGGSIKDRIARRFQEDRRASKTFQIRRRSPVIGQLLESIARLTSPVL